MNLIRKLYDWVLHWAETPYGIPALAILAFAEASFFPVPPDILLIALALGIRKKAFHFAFYCSLFSILGALFGYSLGHFLWWNGPGEFSALARFFFDKVPGLDRELFFRIGADYDRWNFWVIFTAGFTPIPYKVFTITAGAFDINLAMFLVASIISRSARFFLVGGLIWKFGAPIRDFIDRYFNWLALLFTLLLLGGFWLVKTLT
ncbi:MAG: YqaA family protein [Fidelibacterota bacterium]